VGIKELLTPWFKERQEKVETNPIAACKMTAKVQSSNAEHTMITFFLSGQNIGTLTFKTDKLADELMTFTAFFNESPWDVLPEHEAMWKAARDRD